MKSMIPESLRLLVVGINHKTAPLTVREAVAFSPEQTIDALRRLKARFPDAEAAIVSTCNRVEIYAGRPVAKEPTAESLAQFIAEFHGISPEKIAGHIYSREDRQMIEHLFGVASSLDSMVVGETQILSQVKQAYQAAQAEGAVGKVFHALFQRALAAAKAVHEQTAISAGRLSIASVAVDLARSVFDRFGDKTVLCVGAGKMAALLLTHLAELKPQQLIVTNRTAARAQELAAHFQAAARPFESLDTLLTEADIILTSTGATQPIITEAGFKSLLKARRYRPVVIIDIAVPRDVEPGVGKLNNVYLYNIDDLQEVAAGNREKRDREIAVSRELLATHVEDFLHWFAARDVGPLVKALYEQCHALARAELEAALERHPSMSAEEKAELERLTHRLVGKILHGPVSRLTANAESTARPMMAEALRKLFALEAGESSQEHPQ